MIRIVLTLLIGLTCFTASAQRQTNGSRSELGVLVGGSYYIGDLNRFAHFRNTNLAGGLLYRYNFHSRTTWRTTLIYGEVEAYDSESSWAQQQQRNLNFNSTIWEFASGIEFNYFPFRIGSDRYKGTAYLFAQLGLFRMNPKTDYNGDQIELQPLGTEGQGTSLSSKSRYNKIQLVVPLGIGARVSLGKSASLGIEFGLRKTFTDYLDDVGADTYVDPDLLMAESGPLASELSNRSGSRFGKRGTSSTKDWYVFSGATLTFRLGKPSNCHYKF